VDNQAPPLEKAIQGDEEAFASLVDLYQVPVFNLCFRMLGDSNEAEEAAQETFLRAFLGIKRYDRSKSFSTWLLSIAAHYCIDQLRRRKMTLVPLEALPYEEIADPLPSPESSLNVHEQQQKVRALLNALNPTDRAIVVMYYWQDMSNEQIAQALNLTVSAVKSRLHRARIEMARVWMKDSNSNPIGEVTRYESRTV
jgi:RNA polymerase sigma-70 factor (ECF subfamily)